MDEPITARRLQWSGKVRGIDGGENSTTETNQRESQTVGTSEPGHSGPYSIGSLGH